jgi:DNA-directed RNA polymerase I, II, and III subunit RPABC5
MIIPIRCFTCGKMLADKWEYYDTEVKKTIEEAKRKDPDVKEDQVSRAEILDKLHLKRMCCRRHFLGHVDLIDRI